MFTLLKWYLDLVTEDGAVFLGYAARLRWRRLALHYASSLVVDAAGARRERATARRTALPARGAGAFTWCCEPLGVAGRWTGRAPPIRRTLADTDAGAIRWACVAPRAEARVLCEGRALAGLGYVERLSLTIPPWRLPFDTLRWGRYLSSEHALVWIDWAGDPRRSWAWLDGKEQDGAQVMDHGVAGLDGGAELGIHGLRPIRERRVLASVTATLPALARVLPRSLAALAERKWVGRGELRAAGQPADRGWAVHEVVSWRSGRSPS